MDNRNTLGGTFDTNVSLYARMRPGYVPALYRAIFDYQPIDEASRVLEVGSGSGQATLPLLQTGCALTAVEPGENFSARLEKAFGGFPGFKVITAKFEDAALEKNAYDLVFSATAFHWVPEAIGYQKVYDILKPGGAFARFANRPSVSRDDPALAEEIDALYDEYYNKHYGIRSGKKKAFAEGDAETISLIPEQYGFRAIQYRLFRRERVFAAREYTQLLGTYSDHIALGEENRNTFFRMIEEAIDRHGGIIVIKDTLDLELARK